MKQFTIDQAGKIENTSHDTILALCSDNINYSIKVPKKLKQELFKGCKKKYKKNLTLRVFSYVLYLLLYEQVNEQSVIIIDDEYPGHGKDIKRNLLTHLQQPYPVIKFDLVGKKDISHQLANQTFRGRIKPHKVVTYEELNLPVFIPDKVLKKMRR